MKTGRSLISKALVLHQGNSVAIRGHHAWNVIGVSRYAWDTLSSIPTTDGPGFVTAIISQWSLWTDWEMEASVEVEMPGRRWHHSHKSEYQRSLKAACIQFTGRQEICESPWLHMLSYSVEPKEHRAKEENVWNIVLEQFSHSTLNLDTKAQK